MTMITPHSVPQSHTVFDIYWMLWAKLFKGWLYHASLIVSSGHFCSPILDRFTNIIDSQATPWKCCVQQHVTNFRYKEMRVWMDFLILCQYCMLVRRPARELRARFYLADLKYWPKSVECSVISVLQSGTFSSNGLGMREFKSKHKSLLHPSIKRILQFHSRRSDGVRCNTPTTNTHTSTHALFNLRFGIRFIVCLS